MTERNVIKPAPLINRLCFRNVRMGRVLTADALTSRPIWMYSEANAQEALRVESKWVLALNKLGFQAITPRKIARNIRTLMKRRGWDLPSFGDRFKEAAAEVDILSPMNEERASLMLRGEDQAVVMEHDLVILASLFGIPKHELYAGAQRGGSLGLYRVYAIFHDKDEQSIVLSTSRDAAIQAMVYDLIFGGDPLEKSPRDWFNVSIECSLITAWSGAVEIEELQGWIGRIMTKSGRIQKEMLSFPR